MSRRQIYANDDLIIWNRDNLGNGEGTTYGKFAFTRNEADTNWAIKELGFMTLEPGASIGLHKHETNEDAYVIISGEGIFTDSAGNSFSAKQGTITIARNGDMHALKNTGKLPLVFVGIIASK